MYEVRRMTYHYEATKAETIAKLQNKGGYNIDVSSIRLLSSIINKGKWKMQWKQNNHWCEAIRV